jgi:hypothetical protein
MSDEDILGRISGLVQEEHQLRQDLQSGGDAEQDRTRLAELEQALDQCWDLLRQRRAHREFDQETDSQVRPKSQVEGYLQ